MDFEPDLVHFTKNKNKYYSLLLCNYAELIRFMCRRLKFKNVYYNSGEDFDDAKDRVKCLYKDLKK